MQSLIIRSTNAATAAADTNVDLKKEFVAECRRLTQKLLSITSVYLI